MLAIQNIAAKFDGSGSTDNQHISAYEWDFEDGTEIPTVVKPRRIYTENGGCNVTLTVYNKSGNRDTAEIKVKVLDKNYNVSEFYIVDSKTKQPLANVIIPTRRPRTSA